MSIFVSPSKLFGLSHLPTFPLPPSSRYKHRVRRSVIVHCAERSLQLRARSHGLTLSCGGSVSVGHGVSSPGNEGTATDRATSSPGSNLTFDDKPSSSPAAPVKRKSKDSEGKQPVLNDTKPQQ